MDGVPLFPGEDAPTKCTRYQLTDGDVDHGTDTPLRYLSLRHSELLKAMEVPLVEVRFGLDKPCMIVGNGDTTLGWTTPSIWYGKLDGEGTFRTYLQKCCVGRIGIPPFDRFLSIHDERFGTCHVSVLDAPSTNGMCKVRYLATVARYGIDAVDARLSEDE